MRCNRFLALVVLITVLTTIPLFPGSQPVAEANANASWPSLWSHYPVIANGQITDIRDPAGDVNPSLIDFTSGTTVTGQAGTQPSVQVASMEDATGSFLFVRFRMADTPVKKANDLDTNFVALAEIGVNSSHRLTVGIDGGADAIYAVRPNGTGKQSLPYVSWTQVSAVPEGTGEYFVDVRFPLSLIQQVDNTITKTTPLQFLFGTSTQTNNINKDFTVGEGCWSCVLPITFGPANLSLTATSGATTPPIVGVDTDYSIAYAVNNSGMNTASSVVVTDTLPANVSVKGTPPAGVTVTGQTVVWSIGSLGIGGSATLTLPVVLTPTPDEWGATVPLDAGAVVTGFDEAASVDLTASAAPLTVGPVRNPVPTLTAISPSSSVLGSGGFTMTLSGGNFLPGSEVRVNGVALAAVTYVSPTELRAEIPAGVTGAAGNHAITVYNPDNSQALGGGESTSQTLSVALAALELSVSDNQVYVQETVTLSASGGTGGYLYTVATNNSGATVTGTTYTAGSVGGVTDTVKVTSGGQEATAQIEVLKRPTLVQVTCDPTAVAVGQTVACTVAVTDTTGSSIPVTGDVTVTVGDTTIGTCTLGAPCQVTYTPTGAGTPAITATYEGSDAHAGGSGSQQVTVHAGLSLTAAKSQVYVQESITLSASGGTGSYAYALQTNNSGATVTGATYTAGSVGGVTDTVKVTSGGQEATAQIEVLKRPTLVQVTCDPTAVAVGQTVTCTVAVTDTTGSSIPVTGDVTVTVGDTTIGTCTLGAPCQVTYTPTGAGTPAITATYEGSDSHAGGSGSQSVSVGSGILSGTVTTDFGTAVVGVDLVLLSSGTPTAQTSSSAGGAYSFAGLLPGNYTVRAVSGSTTLVEGTATLPEGGNVILDLTIPTTANLTLTATPPRIVGDGSSTSELKAELRLADGTVIPGVTVTFATTAGTLSATGGVTGANGAASTTLTAPRIESATKVEEQASVVVQDVQRGLFARATIDITFLPPVIEGVVMDNGEPRRPVENAEVTVRRVVNGETVFEATTLTDATGHYTVTIPKGNVAYEVIIKVPLQVNGKTVYITSTQTVEVGALSGEGEEIPAPKTVNGILVPPAGMPGGWAGLNEGLDLTGRLRDSKGNVLPNAVTLREDGTFQIDDVPVGTYDVVFQVEVNGQRLVGAKMQITVATDGELSIVSALVDPFGVVTDKDSGTPLTGVYLELRYADTDELVTLPTLPDFAPNQNQVPWTTLAAGDYAWMVYPNRAYYITATKSGYKPYNSKEHPEKDRLIGDSRIENGIIYVGETIVEYDIQMEKRPVTPPPPAPPAEPSPTVTTTTTIRGVVIDSATGRPLAGARVTIPELAIEGTTATDGAYQLTVPHRDRTYTVQVSATVQLHGKPHHITTTQVTAVPQSQATNLTANARRKIVGRLFYTGLTGGEPTPLTAQQASTIRATLERADGTPVSIPVTVANDGVYAANDLPAGTYRVLFRSEGTDGRLLAVTTVTVPLTQEGQLGLQATLIAPTATVSDAVTGAPLNDVLVSLFWADTATNRAEGRIPGTLVTLPSAPAFFGHGNANPHLTNDLGRYGWLCLPKGDTYVIAKKDGYLPYDSRTTGQSACGFDMQLQPVARQEMPEYRRYIRGYPDGTFRSQNQITRAEVATIFARILGANLDTVEPATFTDLPASHWASRHIAVVVERGLMKGYPGGTFQPDKPITRAELATVIVRFKGLPLANRNVFQDSAGHWAEASISAAFEAGIVLGFTDSTFGPSRTTTRAELVAMVNRMLGWSQLMTGRAEPRWPDVPFTHWAVRHVEKASISHTAKREADQFDYLVEELTDTLQ